MDGGGIDQASCDLHPFRVSQPPTNAKHRKAVNLVEAADADDVGVAQAERTGVGVEHRSVDLVDDDFYVASIAKVHEVVGVFVAEAHTGGVVEVRHQQQPRAGRITYLFDLFLGKSVGIVVPPGVTNHLDFEDRQCVDQRQVSGALVEYAIPNFCGARGETEMGVRGGTGDQVEPTSLSATTEGEDVPVSPPEASPPVFLSQSVL